MINYARIRSYYRYSQKCGRSKRNYNKGLGVDMIKIKKENYFKVLKPELFKAGEEFLGKYELYINKALEKEALCFYKSFGTKEAFEYGSYNSMCMAYFPEKQRLSLHCCSYGGMCGFTFDEEELKNKNLLCYDRECMEFTINFIKELINNGVIENE